MDKFKESANKKIQETIHSILIDAEYEIKRNPKQKEDIKAFCEDLMNETSNFFKKYQDNKIISRDNSENKYKGEN